MLAVGKLVLPLKKARSEGEAPDFRPVSVPQSDCVCIERAASKQFEDAHREYLMPPDRLASAPAAPARNLRGRGVRAERAAVRVWRRGPQQAAGAGVV